MPNRPIRAAPATVPPRGFGAARDVAHDFAALPLATGVVSGAARAAANAVIRCVGVCSDPLSCFPVLHSRERSDGLFL
jgi:hypothetical protein